VVRGDRGQWDGMELAGDPQQGGVDGETNGDRVELGASKTGEQRSSGARNE